MTNFLTTLSLTLTLFFILSLYYFGCSNNTPLVFIGVDESL